VENKRAYPACLKNAAYFVVALFSDMCLHL